jgi:hypothetical protein
LIIKLIVGEKMSIKFRWLFVFLIILPIFSCQKTALEKRTEQLTDILLNDCKPNKVQLDLRKMTFDEFIIFTCGENDYQKGNGELKGLSCRESVKEEAYNEVFKRVNDSPFWHLLIRTSKKELRSASDYKGFFLENGDLIEEFGEDFSYIKENCSK